MKKLALLFPGQASQYVGMGKNLYEKHSFAKDLFEEANSVLGFNIKELCFSGNLAELTKTENTQPALLVCSVAAYKAIIAEFDIKPLFAAGHSIGEISALTCAGAINFADALKIVRSRGKFMQEAVPVGHGKMAAITGTESSHIEALCSKLFSKKGTVVISNYNAPSQYVISGLSADVELLCEELKATGAKVIPLNVSAPFHSPQMEPAAIRMREELSQYHFHSFDFPIVSNINAKPYSNPEMIIDKLVMQIVAPVQWQASMLYLSEQNIDLAFEVGPKTVLKNLMTKNVPGIKTYSYDEKADIDAYRSLFFDFINKCLGIAVSTRNRNFNDAEYVTGVSEPFKKVQQDLQQSEQNSQFPSILQLRSAYAMLLSVLETKKAPSAEIESRINQLFEAAPLQVLLQDIQIEAGVPAY